MLGNCGNPRAMGTELNKTKPEKNKKEKLEK